MRIIKDLTSTTAAAAGAFALLAAHQTDVGMNSGRFCQTSSASSQNRVFMADHQSSTVIQVKPKRIENEIFDERFVSWLDEVTDDVFSELWDTPEEDEAWRDL